MRQTTSRGDGVSARIGRRALLRGALGTAGAISAARFGLSGLAHAQTAPARDTTQRFVFVYVGGGWDQLLFLDPRDPAVLTPNRFASEGIDIHYDQFDAAGFQPGVIRAGALTFGPA